MISNITPGTALDDPTLASNVTSRFDQFSQFRIVYTSINPTGSNSATVPLQVIGKPVPTSLPTNATAITTQNFTVPPATFVANNASITTTVVVQQLINSTWVTVTAPVPPGGSLAPADMAALGADPLTQFQVCPLVVIVMVAENLAFMQVVLCLFTLNT